MDSDTIRSALRRGPRPLLALAAAMAVLTVVCIVGLLVDPRTIVGAPAWEKPFKFSISVGLYAATLAWMVSLLRAPRARRVAGWAGLAVAVTGGIEMVTIVVQVVRGRASHFDQATAFDAALWHTMAGSITALWVATAVIAVLLLRERDRSLTTAWAVRLGLGVALLGMALAFLMALPSAAQLAVAGVPVSGAHTVGGPDGGPGLPLLGWSTVGGDLRIGHFVGLHALQGLPLIALALGALARRVPALAPETVRARLVAVAGLAWAALAVGLTWQALRAQPLLAPDATTLAAAGALVVATLAAAAVVVTRGTTTPAEPRALETV